MPTAEPEMGCFNYTIPKYENSFNGQKVGSKKLILKLIKTVPYAVFKTKHLLKW